MNYEATPGERLRVARERAGVSRKQLALKTGRALSTVRAHENGQNNILPDAAAAYSEELGVDASWLLYGAEVTPPPSKRDPHELNARPVPVLGWLLAGYSSLGQVSGHLSHPLPFETLNIGLPGHEHSMLFAYIEGSLDADENNIEIVFVEPPVDGERLRLVDEVVLEVSFGADKVVERSAWRVGADDGWAVFYQGPKQSDAHALIKTKDLGLDRSFKLVGIVVARLRLVRAWRGVRMPTAI